ncbi:class I SAM-dependent methyltransferase [Syntrophorhabdus aromaticivorans]|jgi:SAM-dependent methyltransferase|uniref:Class I SAM-dependent methyltransferase n=1 Tax=Syntrophorhabdus aromaticivorans TaxID=328301 RepID=A0A971M287_9BACT|nr:class I SAM-dependent methyltransferase [Syntrophorhabdus aromaticivorans]NLW34465.1 class I SAM-dependent methyltransferase [Syntrophorhabdus aromaticivorans]
MHLSLQGIPRKYRPGYREIVLACFAAGLLPDTVGSVLDVGCGNGRLARLVMEQRPMIQLKGIDVVRQDNTAIPVELYDGKVFPYENGSFDAVMIMDMLHHADNALVVLREASRVSRKYVVIKDHLANGISARLRLRFMDYVGNYVGHKRFGVPLPYNFLSSAGWKEMYDASGLSVVESRQSMKLYPPVLQLIFGRGLQFFVLLEKTTFEPPSGGKE